MAHPNALNSAPPRVNPGTLRYARAERGPPARQLILMRLLPSLAAAAALAACHTDHAPDPWASQIIPLARGATWTYKATITHYDETLFKETKTTITWTTSVVDVIPGDGVTAYVMKGWPTDLIGSTGQKPVPTEKVLLRSDDGFLWGQPGVRSASVEHAQGWFATPLQDGQRVCPDPDLTYCWQVAEKDTGYQLSYHAGPEEESYMLVPGRGVTRYDYQQTGTTDQIVAELEDFSPGKPEAAPVPPK